MGSADQPSRLRRVADWLLRIGLPSAVLAIVMAVFWGERLGVDHEVQLVAPSSVEPGGALPVRALVFGDIGSDSGPTLSSRPVDLRLRDADGRLLLEERFEPSPAGGADGNLTIPENAGGTLSLQAIARGADGEALASAQAAVAIGAAEPAPVEGRIAGALQRLSLGDVEVLGEAPAPDVLDARVVGAACVPEAPCTLLVHVGAPAAAIRLVGTESAEAVGEGSAPTEGLARVHLMTHGPEAVAELEALRDGEPVARRPIQIPTALATPGLALSARVIDAGEVPELTIDVLGDRPGVIVDAYLDGRWRRTASLARPTEPVALPFELSAGVWTLQVRTDPFSAERAAVRRLAVGAPPPDVASAPPGDEADRMAWASADQEVRVRRLPEPVRGLPQDLAKLAERQARLRAAALVAIVLGVVVLVIVFLRRGVDAALEAQRVMDSTGDPELMSARHRRRTLLSSLAIVATVAIAFVGAAALIIARARLLE